MNFYDLLILIVVGIAVVLAIRRILRNKKDGKTCCGGDCSACSGCNASKKN